MSGVTSYNRLAITDKLCCYIELLEKINIELNLRNNQGPAGPAISQLVTSFLLDIISNPNFAVDTCDPNPPFPPTMNDPPYCVFGIYLLRDDGSRYRLFDKRILAVDATEGLAAVIGFLANPLTDLIPSGSGNITYSEAVCCLKNHFEQIKKYLSLNCGC